MFDWVVSAWAEMGILLGFQSAGTLTKVNSDCLHHFVRAVVAGTDPSLHPLRSSRAHCGGWCIFTEEDRLMVGTGSQFAGLELKFTA